MHTGMKWWTDERIRWYERASASTDFHSLLADEIASELDRDKPLLEIGCGLGYVSALLYQKGFDISATDIDSEVIRRAGKRTGLSIFSVLDAEKPFFSPQLLMIFYGDIASELERYAASSDRIVTVLSHHSSHGMQTKENRLDMLRKKLSSGFAYSEKRITLSFDQPLLSLDDARGFIEASYGKDSLDRIMPLLDEKMVLPIRKKLSIFTIEKEKP